MQILRAVDQEAVPPPDVDHGAVFLQRGLVGVLDTEHHSRGQSVSGPLDLQLHVILLYLRSIFLTTFEVMLCFGCHRFQDRVG